MICSELHGYLKAKSCSTQLTDVYHEICSISLKQTGIIYLDFSKAFDSVSYIMLLHKKKMYGFNSYLLDWLTSYLTDRNSCRGC